MKRKVTVTITVTGCISCPFYRMQMGQYCSAVKAKGPRLGPSDDQYIIEGHGTTIPDKCPFLKT